MASRPKATRRAVPTPIVVTAYGIRASDLIQIAKGTMGDSPGGAPIILVNRFFYPDESATSQMLTDLALYLSGEGFEVMIVTGRHSSTSCHPLLSREELAGVQIRRVWSLPPKGKSLPRKLLSFLTFYPSAFLALLKLLRPGSIILAKTDPPLISCVAFAAAKLRRALLVNWLQDVYPEVAIELETPLLRGLIGRLLISLRDRALKGASLNVAIGQLMGDRLAARGVPCERITVIPNWADERSIRRLPAEMSEQRQAWGFHAREFVLGYSGNLGMAHEADTLLDAAQQLSDRTDIKFLFIGGGREHSKLHARVEALGLTSFIFKPHQPRESLAGSLAAADAHWVSLRPELEGLIVPSKFYGILAAGRPVVCVTARQGELAQAVSEHGIGFVVQPGDSDMLVRAIETLASSERLRGEMGARARALAETALSKSAALSSWRDALSTVAWKPPQAALGEV